MEEEYKDRYNKQQASRAVEVSAPDSAQAADPANGVQAHAGPGTEGTELGATCGVAGILKPG